MMKFLTILTILISGLPCLAATKPNIIVVLCDDLGRGDLSCYGHPIIKTPNIDQFAKEGILFTDSYSTSPVCSPSRAGLFTGRNPNRASIYDWISSGLVHLRKTEVTIPQLLKTAGYQTMLAGKWHLNGKFNQPKEQPTPREHGFDYWFATHNNASPNHRNPRNFIRNGVPVGVLEGYSSSIVVNELMTWLDKHRKSDQPFASFLTFHEPHSPIASPPDLVEAYMKHQTIPGQAEYWANVGQVDRAVGELMSGLKKRRLDENTMIIFTSDNGPEDWMRYPGVWNAHGTPGTAEGGIALRGMKLDVFEGGIRVSGLIRWPAGIKGKRVVKEPVGAVDILPTLCDVAEANIPADLNLDGVSWRPLFQEEVKLQRKTPLFWFYYNARGYAHFALRDGDYMLLARRTQEEYRAGTPYSPARYKAISQSKTRAHQIFNLRKDPMEVVDLAKEKPERLKMMRSQLDKILTELQKETMSWE